MCVYFHKNCKKNSIIKFLAFRVYVREPTKIRSMMKPAILCQENHGRYSFFVSRVMYRNKNENRKACGYTERAVSYVH